MGSILTINIPFTMTWALPYGPAVVNGIFKDRGYTVNAWDLSIELIRQFEHHPEFKTLSQALSIGGYNRGLVSRSFVTEFLSWARRKLAAKISETKPDVILFSVFSSQSLDFVVPVATWARELAPDAYLSVGGRGLDNTERRTQLNYAEYFIKYLPVNCTYTGDAENQLLQVVESRYQGHWTAKPVNAEELTSAPAAAWDGLEFSKYDGYAAGELRIPLTASKGCVRQCTFCDVAGSWPKYVFRKGEDVGQEIVKIYHDTGINKIEFTDNLVNGSISNFRAMNRVVAEQIPNVIDYMGYAICRPKNEFPERDFELASIAGAKLFKVGIESGSEKVRHDIKKKFSNEDIDWFAHNCSKYNIKQRWLMFVGYPTETEEDFQDTLALLRKHKKLGQDGMITVFLSLPMMLTMNSGFMRNYAVDYGLEHNREDSWSDFFWTSSKYQNNTFDVRVDRWHRFANTVEECGYDSDHGSMTLRQTEKFLELEGLEKIYKEHEKEKKRIIPIVNHTSNSGQGA
jgi:radical SAM superfamily enzyme YgiQ (UPF0313 family)